MDDILSHGAEGSPGWRLVVAAVVIVAAVVAILIARHLPQDVARAHHPATAATSGPVQLAGLGSAAAALLNQGRDSKRACTPHAQVPAVSAPETARSKLDRLCSASAPVRTPVGDRGW
jgi:hypothetical protein